jgi:hypothetical protein
VMVEESEGEMGSDSECGLDEGGGLRRGLEGEIDDGCSCSDSQGESGGADVFEQDADDAGRVWCLGFRD